MWNLPSDPDASYGDTGPLWRGRVNMTGEVYRGFTGDRPGVVTRKLAAVQGHGAIVAQGCDSDPHIDTEGP